MRERTAAEQFLICVECGRVSDDGRGWRAYLVAAGEDGFGDPETVVVYCPDCAEREFHPR